MSDVKEAVLLYVPPEFTVVELTACAVVLVFPSTVDGPVRLWSGGEPVTDQFGTRNVQPRTANMLCAPSS